MSIDNCQTVKSLYEVAIVKNYNYWLFLKRQIIKVLRDQSLVIND